jgi:uncharacterized radical SAM protein YgiQ
MTKKFLPVSKKDMEERLWHDLDIILVSGDAYVDHPSYGIAVISRVLEDAGFRVGIIAQPDCSGTEDFSRLGRPRLFFGVSAGNLDSMVANYTANKKPRSEDDYSAGGRAGLRPDRADIIYTNRIREAFTGVTVILGGIEASLRRLAHYDYWSDKVRRSILLDSKADMLVYGMGEQQIVEIAKRMDGGENVKSVRGIRGTVIVASGRDTITDKAVEIPSFEEVSSSKDKFMAAFTAIYREQDPFRGRAIAQKHGTRTVLQYPPARPNTTKELDRIYGLPFMRKWHTSYEANGGVPGFETVRFSVVSHRGCAGECSFCSLYMHQGRIVRSRSRESIIKEIRELAADKEFKGTITDIGGPTANMYMSSCRNWSKVGACASKKCLVPEKCENFNRGYNEIMKLWEEALKIPLVKHIFIGSGVRYDMVSDDLSQGYLKRLCEKHVSGRLKIAPEHAVDEVLRLMNKPKFAAYRNFVDIYRRLNKSIKKDQYLANYIVSAHPGATIENALELSLELMKMRIYPDQVQDFIPLPMTASGCMYYTEKDFFTGKPIYVAKGERERKLQRSLVQYKNPDNKRYVIEALRVLGRMDLSKYFFKKGVAYGNKGGKIKRGRA